MVLYDVKTAHVMAMLDAVAEEVSGTTADLVLVYSRQP
jgi:hypothetical protein